MWNVLWVLSFDISHVNFTLAVTMNTNLSNQKQFNISSFNVWPFSRPCVVPNPYDIFLWNTKGDICEILQLAIYTMKVDGDQVQMWSSFTFTVKESLGNSAVWFVAVWRTFQNTFSYGVLKPDGYATAWKK